MTANYVHKKIFPATKKVAERNFDKTKTKYRGIMMLIVRNFGVVSLTLALNFANLQRKSLI